MPERIVSPGPDEQLGVYLRGGVVTLGAAREGRKLKRFAELVNNILAHGPEAERRLEADLYQVLRFFDQVRENAELSRAIRLLKLRAGHAEKGPTLSIAKHGKEADDAAD